jgi:ribosomal protein S18 acetylase RimI-like enzyme
MKNIHIKKIKSEELPLATQMLGKAFATQPSSFAIYKGVSDRELLSNRMALVFEALLKSSSGQVFVAKKDGEIVGVMRMLEWPQCQLSPSQRLRMLPLMVRSGGGFGALKRGLEYRGAWAKHDPKKPHYHLDPLGVSPDLQGKGIGSQMMEYYCSIVDSKKMDAYHETDRPENVGFYEKFGFEVIEKEDVLGFPNWYMWRSSNNK